MEKEKILHIPKKKLNEMEVKQFRDRFLLPISDEHLADIPYYKPKEDSVEIQYLKERRKELGGYLPSRSEDCIALQTPEQSQFEEFYKGSNGRKVSTTMIFVRILSKLLKNKEIGKYIVPIVPDEARTFGMEALFRQAGIYSSVGQLYEPVDSDSLLYYKESKDGQILEEGINEAGSMSSFIAAGTAYSNYGIPTIPFYIYYSMFGFQRIGDLAWLAGDSMCRGFMLGGTSGRTTLNGEGLQHEDGHSHIHAATIPNLISYDPAFSYEIAVIIRDGIRRMYEKQEKVFYYLTLCNENYEMPEMPNNIEEGILKGMYKLIASKKKGPKVHLFGSASILNCAIEAKKILEEQYKLSVDVWSITSYTELRKDALECDRYNLLNVGKKEKIPYLTKMLNKEKGIFIAASDYMKLLPDSIRKWVPSKFFTLGTDGFGMSDSREKLREHFEVDANYIAFSALSSLVKEKQLEASILKQAQKSLHIKANKKNPMAT